jgi:K+-transporting ATPase KdpF subunit
MPPRVLRPHPRMDYVYLIHQHLGLVVFTALSVGLIVYLAYSMLHPERF